MKIAFLALSLACSSACLSQATTGFSEGTREYGKFLRQLEDMLMHSEYVKTVTLGGRPRHVFVPWIRDNVHVTKAMKYLVPDVESFTSFYLENQTPEGLYYDYYYPLSFGGTGQGDRKKIFPQRYWKVFPSDSIQMHRLPVEADLEYLLVEGVYAIWQSTGDTAFMRKWLPALVKGMHYSMTDPLRWSEKYQLVKRGYTLDTWDFMQLPTSRDEYTKNGGNVQKGIFYIDEHTPMGIMHGDNSGMYAACRQLSDMFRVVRDDSASEHWNKSAAHFREATNRLCWNGKYFAHFVPDDPMPTYLKIDQKNTLSLSNPYDINRGLPTEPMAESIIETYKALKELNKAHSFAEWYGIYPAVVPHFADYQPGSYMNGGVNTIVAGELAKAALEHGEEEYGIDILHRLMDLTAKHGGDLPVSYTPEGMVDKGIPDNWGQAAVYSALIEGLAGVVDKGSQFSFVEISPRWMAAGIDSATVTIAYGPTHKNVRYTYEHLAGRRKINLRIQSPAADCTVRILLPSNAGRATATVNHLHVSSQTAVLRKSKYLVIHHVKGDSVVEISY